MVTSLRAYAALHNLFVLGRSSTPNVIRSNVGGVVVVFVIVVIVAVDVVDVVIVVVVHCLSSNRYLGRTIRLYGLFLFLLPLRLPTLPLSEFLLPAPPP